MALSPWSSCPLDQRSCKCSIWICSCASAMLGTFSKGTYSPSIFCPFLCLLSNPTRCGPLQPLWLPLNKPLRHWQPPGRSGAAARGPPLGTHHRALRRGPAARCGPGPTSRYSAARRGGVWQRATSETRFCRRRLSVGLVERRAQEIYFRSAFFEVISFRSASSERLGQRTSRTPLSSNRHYFSAPSAS